MSSDCATESAQVETELDKVVTDSEKVPLTTGGTSCSSQVMLNGMVQSAGSVVMVKECEVIKATCE